MKESIDSVNAILIISHMKVEWYRQNIDNISTNYLQNIDKIGNGDFFRVEINRGHGKIKIQERTELEMEYH